MLTPAEYLKAKFPQNNTLWLSGMDIVRHCLKKDATQTFFKDNQPNKNMWHDWSASMTERAKSDDNFQEIYDNAYQPKPKPHTIADDNGLLDISSYIAGETLCFENEISLIGNTDAVSVLIDLGIPYRDRKESYMITRHKKIYDLIAQCDGENRPIQVIGCFGIAIPELSEPIICFIVIKDYSDPIFPTIWGVLKNNKTANAFLNVIMDYFIGTREDGNGTIKTIGKAEQYFADNENLIIYGTRIKSDNATYIND